MDVIEVQEVLEYWIDSNGVEIVNPINNGRGIIVSDILFRTGNKVKISLKTGEFYIGIIQNISTLSPKSKKNISIIDDNKVRHIIKYKDIIQITMV